MADKKYLDNTGLASFWSGVKKYIEKNYQEKLVGTAVEGQNIKTINNETLLGNGNIEFIDELIVDDKSTKPVNNGVKMYVSLAEDPDLSPVEILGVGKKDENTVIPPETTIPEDKKYLLKGEVFNLTEGVSVDGDVIPGNKATGWFSHAEGRGTIAENEGQHAQGRFNTTNSSTPKPPLSPEPDTKAIFSIGNGTSDIDRSDAMKMLDDGTTWIAGVGDFNGRNHSHDNSLQAVLNNAAGQVDKTPDAYEHGEIFNDYTNNKATGEFSHAEGDSTTASGESSHAEGWLTAASGRWSHAEGDHTTASGDSSHAEGDSTTASGEDSHAEGDSTTASGESSHAEGYKTIANDKCSHAEGRETTASGNYSHAEGRDTIANGGGSHAEGKNTNALGWYSHAEGDSTTASGDYSHAEGYMSQTEFTVKEHLVPTTGNNFTTDHIEYYPSKVIDGIFTHDVIIIDESTNTVQSSDKFVSIEGDYDVVHVGENTHVEGKETKAIGDNSHAEGENTVAFNKSQHSQGQFNTKDTRYSSSVFDITKTIFSIGNGTSDTDRSDALKMLGNGTTWISGVGTFTGKNADETNSLQSVLNKKQEKLVGTAVEGQNIKTINGETILGSGDFQLAFKTELPTAEDKAKWNGYDEEIKENARVTAGALVHLDEKTTCPQDDNVYAHQNKEWTDISNRLLPPPPPIGVRILHTNGKLFKETDWDQSWNSEAVGVYVGDDKGHRFIVAKTNTTPEKPQWGGYRTEISGITTTTDENTAKQDWNGKDNTDKIVAQLGDGELSGNYAARLCKLYAFPGRWNGKGYLGSVAEWMLVYQNKDEINKCLLKCGGTQIDTNWTSTQYNSNSAWYLDWGNGILSTDNKFGTSFYARAFAAFEVEEYITKTELNKILNERLNIIDGGHA